MAAIVDLAERIEEMRERIEDLGPVLRPAAEALEGDITKSFSTGTGILGNKWAANKQSTIDRKGSNSPLVDNNLLSKAVHAIADKNSILFGVSGDPLTYARVHQYGHTFEWGKVPARPFLPLDGDKASLRSGKAKVWFERTRDRILKYIIKGSAQ